MGASFDAVYILLVVGNRCASSSLLHETDHAQGTNIDTGEDVAIKLEHVSIDPSLLKGEADTYYGYLYKYKYL